MRKLFLPFILGITLTFGFLVGLAQADSPAPRASHVLFVDATATGAADGSSWADAYTNVQDALAVALSGYEIWVATGVYYPDVGSGQVNDVISSTFAMADSVALYGGFDGTETTRSQRDPVANVTVLSGDIDQNDTTDPNGVVTDTANIAGSNAYHVVTGSNTNSAAILDGFTITAGSARDNWPFYSGGGMYNDSGNPTLANLVFSGNRANNDGGGMYNTRSSPALTNIIFSGNSAANGGGMKNFRDSSPVLTNVTFSGNSAISNGGGLSNDAQNFSNANVVLINVTFSNNTALNGGGVHNNRDSRPTLTNVTFSGNTATSLGGGMYNLDDNQVTLINVTFSGNSAISNGGGMYNNGRTSHYLVVLTMTNVIIANNTNGDCVNVGNLTIDVSSSNNLIEDTGSNACGLTDGVDNNIIGQDPALDVLTDFGGNGKQVFPLLAGSPAISAGTNTGCPATDQRGAARPVGANCDIGAFEFSLVLYVDADAVGANSGASWTDAYTKLQDAIATAPTGIEIWVAEGVYYPDEGIGQTNNAVTSTFTLNAGVAIYGGFAGTETSLSERDSTANITVLSGDIDGNDTTDSNGIITTTNNIAGTNGYHVVTGASGITETAVLDGFTITGGVATNVSPPHYLGGGMYNNNSSPTLGNLSFSGNGADFGGGLSNNAGSNPTLTNVIFINNTGTFDGGGMYNNASSPTLVNVVFYNNAATYGAGMFNTTSSDATLTNVTLTGNSAYDGGGMYNRNSTPVIKNTIFWGNTGSNSGPQIFNDTSTPVISYSDIETALFFGSWDNALGTDGGGNIDADPLFVDATNGNVRLQTGSPAIDTGTNTGCSAMDLDGNARPVNATCDMGAYEFLYMVYLPLIIR